MPKILPIIERTCRLCDEEFLTQNRSIRYCPQCLEALDSYARSAVANEPWKKELFLHRLRYTGKRTKVLDDAATRNEYDTAIGINKAYKLETHYASECRQNCKYKGKCGPDDCCDYLLITGHSRPKDAGPVGMKCRCYEPTTDEFEKYKKDRFNNYGY